MMVKKAFRTEALVVELCCKHKINEFQSYKWNKQFLEKGNRRMEGGDIIRESICVDMLELRQENARLKEIFFDLVLRYYIVRKAWGCWVKHKI